ncbi:MAG: hypothetical protein GY805_32745 [Chloroflexi bacterium]|nr:hypothetical protein [Chloroflexota bacterium]
MSQFTLLVFIFVIGILAIKLWQHSQAEKKVSNFKAIAQQTGWLFENNGRQALYNQLDQFQVFQRGSWQDIQGVLIGQFEGTDFHIISFRHGSMTGIPTEYLILLIEDEKQNLPTLAFRHKKGGFLFKNGITLSEFDAYPLLKQNYALQTEYPDEARKSLHANLLETLILTTQSSHLLEIEMTAARFLCYQRKKGEGNVKTETLQEFVRLGIQIYRQM